VACGVGRGACAAELMAEKGSEAFRMSDIVERSGVPFGSPYQYFPDKTAIIDTLAERYNNSTRRTVSISPGCSATRYGVSHPMRPQPPSPRFPN